MKIKQLSNHFAIFDTKDRKPNPHTFKLRKAMIKAGIPLICNQCGSIDGIEAHHKDNVIYLKTPKGNTYQDPNGNHSIANGVMLCKSCHRKLHSTR